MLVQCSRIMSLPFVGYALSLALMALSGWSSYAVLSPVLSQPDITVVRLYQTFLFAVAFLVFAAGSGAWRRHSVAATVLCEGSFLLGLGAFAAALAAGPKAAMLAAMVAATFLPVSRAGFLALWIGVIGDRNKSGQGKGLVIAWVASSLFLVLSGGGFNHAWFLLVVSGAFSLANVGLLLFCVAGSRDVGNLGVADGSEVGGVGDAEVLEVGRLCLPGIASFWGSAWPLILFGALLSFCAEIISRMTLAANLWAELPPGLLTSICKFVAAFALLFLWKRFGRVETLSKVFPPLYFLVMTCCVPLSFFGEAFLGFAGIATSLVSAVFTILMTIACVDAAQRSGLPPAQPFCLFAGLFYLGMAAGDLVGILSGMLVGAESSFYSAILLACVYVLSIGFFLLLRLQGKRAKSAAVPHGAEPESDTVGQGDTILNGLDGHRVDELSASFGLSRRERDVLVLLAQGRDAPFVAKKLFITENTVRSHVKKIYVKMGIHSRQELFDLVHPEGEGG